MGKIMIVDDDEDLRDLMNKMFQKAGFEVITSANGQDCLNKLNVKQRPDIILLDVMMPMMDGWEVSRRIKANESLKDIYVCMLTIKNTMLDTFMSLESAHANWHLNKPIHLTELLVTIKWLLKEKPDSILSPDLQT